MSDIHQLLTPDSIVNNATNNNDTYCLRWTRHKYMLSDALELNNDEISTNVEDDALMDLTVHLDDGSHVRLHSVVLAASSHFFRGLGEHHSGLIDLVMPETSREDLLTVISFLYTGISSIQASRLPAVTEIGVALGLSSLMLAITEMVNKENKKDENMLSACSKVQASKQQEASSRPQTYQRLATSSSPTYFERRSSSPLYSVSPKSRSVSPVPGPHKRSVSPSGEEPTKKARLCGVPMLQSILTQLPLNKPLGLAMQGKLPGREKEQKWDSLGTDMAFVGTDLGQQQRDTGGQLRGLGDQGGLGTFPGCSSQLASLLSAAAKLKAVAEHAMQGSPPESKLSEFGGRKLAFHEPRPCPVCKRMYRDAATLRTHTAIMHSEGAEPFRCSCGISFGTKYQMYQHKKAGHPPVQT